MTAALQEKRCQKCNKDLTGQKRLKDAKGNYWCPECGVGDVSPTASGLVSPCPKCQTPVHAANLVRDKKTGAYVCENCAAGIKVKGGAKIAAADTDAPVDEEAAKKQRNIIIACGMIVAGGVVYYVMNNYVI